MLIAGVDEVGRGPLAGPVVACAVILNPDYPIEGLKDSKKLSEKKREILAEQIKNHALCWAIGVANVKEIDKFNILQASLLAMQRAVEKLTITPNKVLVDGNQLPKITIPAEAIIGGDNLIAQISAASIVAKVARDNYMVNLGKKFPEYGFAQHKGYPTAAHMQAIAQHGITAHHRLSFAPVRAILEAEKA